MRYEWYSEYGKPRLNNGLFANGGFTIAVTPRLNAGAEAGYWSAMDFIDSPDLKTLYVAPSLKLALPARSYFKIATGPARHWGDHGHLHANSLLGSAEAGIDFGRRDSVRFELFAGYQHFFLGHQPNPRALDEGTALPPSKSFSGSLLQFGLRVSAK